MRAIGPRSSVSSRARRGSSACGWATTRTGGLARHSSPKTFWLTARSCTRMNGGATGGVIQPMPRFVMGSMNGRAMMMVMADAKSIVTPVRERARHFGPTCVPSGAFTSNTCICMWRRMRRWSMRNASHPSCFAGCVWVAYEGTLATHEPPLFVVLRLFEGCPISLSWLAGQQNLLCILDRLI